MSRNLILASGSSVRADMLRQAQVPFAVEKPRVDEVMVRDALLAEGETPRNIADALAQLKAERVSRRHPEAFVLGCDQVLEFEGAIISKPESPEEAADQLRRLSGNKHRLFTAAVICEEGRPVWRKLSEVRLTMRPLSEDYLADYVARNWPEIGWSCGAYQLEAEGARLFTRVDGDFFAVLGLPLLEVIDYLVVRGAIAA